MRTHWERAGRPQLLSPPRITGREGEAQTALTYRLLRTVLQAAVDDGLISQNPCKIKGAGTATAPERPTATLAKIKGIFAASPERYRTAVLIAALGGLRAEEVFALSRSDVDIDARCVTVDRSLSYLAGKGFLFGEPKTLGATAPCTCRGKSWTRYLATWPASPVRDERRADLEARHRDLDDALKELDAFEESCRSDLAKLT